MKKKILDSINDYVGTLNTMFKISAASFARENFPKVVENFWEEGKTDEENVKAVRDMFVTNEKLNTAAGHTEAAKVISIYLEGWFDKIK